MTLKKEEWLANTSKNRSSFTNLKPRSHLCSHTIQYYETIAVELRKILEQNGRYWTAAGSRQI